MTPPYIYAKKKVFLSNIIPECSVPLAPYWHVAEHYHSEPTQEQPFPVRHCGNGNIQLSVATAAEQMICRDARSVNTTMQPPRAHDE